MSELYELTVAQAQHGIRTGDVSAVALAEALRNRIEPLEPTLKAWVTIDREEVLSTARERDQEREKGGLLGPLHGIPVGLKDIFYTAGMKTTACSKIYADFVPTYDATSVARLKEAGAVILGKAVTTEFASGDPSPTRNPWNLAHTPGGSSSGSSVAVATRMVPAALGTQTGGSTCRPASYNGIVGLKPSYGRISRYGVIPAAWSLDTVGILVTHGGGRRYPAGCHGGIRSPRPQLFAGARPGLPCRAGQPRRSSQDRPDPRVLPGAERRRSAQEYGRGGPTPQPGRRYHRRDSSPPRASLPVTPPSVP